MTISDFIWQAVVIMACWAGGAAVCRLKFRGQLPVYFTEILRKTRHIYLAFPLLLICPFINVYLARDPSLQWDMPAWLQIHWAALSWGAISGLLAYVFGFCCLVTFIRKHPQRWKAVYFAVAVLAVIQAYAGWSSRPNLPPLGEARISKDGVILQTTPYTCVPASGANIAAILGVRTTERELAQLCHTTRDGTFPAQALHGMKQLGISGKKIQVFGKLRDVKPPAMLFLFGDTHAVVFTGMKDGFVEISNPSFGKSLVPEWRLNQMWEGHTLVFERDRN